jgi:ABC-type nickel/cobalt efflux system permease component RcnA
MSNPGKLAVIVFALYTILFTNAAAAHPLGNFSINHYSAIRVGEDSIKLKYIIDMAEIPTFQEIQENGITPRAGNASFETYLDRKAASWRDGLLLQIGGQKVVLQVDSKEVLFSDGAGGLPTMNIGVVYKAALAVRPQSGPVALDYRDGNFPERAGWKEIVAAGESGVKLLNSSVPEKDRSTELSNYPTDLLNTPPQQLEAHVQFSGASVAALPRPPANAGEAMSASRSKTARTLAHSSLHIARAATPVNPEPVISADRLTGSTAVSESAAVRLQPNRQATPRNSFTELMARKQLGLGIILLAIAVAVGLGAFHALEPGHGKTLVAAYLVGSRGTMKHALMLGLIVTATHTAGVYMLGVVTLYASRYIVPDRLYPWLGVMSGVIIASVGLILLVRRYLGKDGVLVHDHGHTHHHHHQHEHAHKHEHHHHDGRNQNVSLRQLLALGISGGIVPCPAALVVLLGAVSMQRIGFGLLLIVAFSVGLAAVLIAIGLLMVYARQFMTRFQMGGRMITRWLPLTSSVFILLIGVALTLQALQTILRTAL